VKPEAILAGQDSRAVQEVDPALGLLELDGQMPGERQTGRAETRAGRGQGRLQARFDEDRHAFDRRGLDEALARRIGPELAGQVSR